MESYDFNSNLQSNMQHTNGYWPMKLTNNESIPKIRVDSTTTPINSQYNIESISTQPYLVPQVVEARWASADSTSMESPKIVASYRGMKNEAPRVRSATNDSTSMLPLNLECDPNAWDLESHEMLGNICKYIILIF